MLPDDFKWGRTLGAPHLCLMLDGVTVAALVERNDGGYFARLWMHWPVTAPAITRQCTSLEAGMQGCELWALRHLDRLRREVAAKPRPVHRGAG